MSSFTAFSSATSIVYAREASQALGKDYWAVNDGFNFYIESPDSDKWVHVPKGFLTDGASVPRVVWGLIPPWGIYGQAAILHDYLCEYLSITFLGKPHPITRAQADSYFNDALIVLKVPEATRKTLYAAVSAYREITGVNKPSNVTAKREQEALWYQRYAL